MGLILNMGAIAICCTDIIVQPAAISLRVKDLLATNCTKQSKTHELKNFPGRVERFVTAV